MLSHLLLAQEICVIDIETSGLSRNKGGEILEVGACIYNVSEHKIKKSFSTYVKPYRLKKIPTKVTEITGITYEDIVNAPNERVVLTSLVKFIGNRLVCCHNASFDWNSYLLPGFDNIGVIMNNSVICSYVISKYLLPKVGYKGSFKLCDLVSYFGGYMESSHRACVDAKYTVGLVNKLRCLGIELGVKSNIPINKEPKRFLSFESDKILSVSYWKKASYERLYITTYGANVFYDYKLKDWFVKDIKAGSFMLSDFVIFLMNRLSIVDIDDWLMNQKKQKEVS